MGLHHDPGPAVPRPFLLRRYPSPASLDLRLPPSISPGNQLDDSRGPTRRDPGYHAPADAVGAVPGSRRDLLLAVERIQRIGA